MPISLGTTTITALYLGTTSISSAYLGNTQVFGGSFTPLSLFSGGAQGIWLDPSDVANLAWRRNLLTYSEDASNAIWVKERSSVSATTGGYLATVTGVSFSLISQVVAGTSGVPVTFTVIAKAGSANCIRIGAQNGTAGFDLANGTATAGGTISAVGDGFYKCTVSYTGTAGQVNYIYLTDVAGSVPPPASGASLTIKSAQLELGSTATEYQRITDVNTEVIERFPTATMFSDRAGTTPVTTPGTVVGLRLDKSKGLVLGSELVVNGNFATNLSGWTATAAWTWDAGEAKGILASSGDTLIQTFATLAPGWVEFGYRVTSGGLRCAIRGADGLYSTLIANTLSGTGTFRAFVSQPFDGIQFARSGAGTMYVDNVSVKQLPGNHAVAPTDAARPIYGVEPKGGRRNLLTWTEDFTNAFWFKSGATVTATSHVAPNGVAGVSQVSLSNTTGARVSLTGAFSAIPGTNYAWSGYLKAATPADIGKRTTMYIYDTASASFKAVKAITLTADWERHSSTATSAAGNPTFFTAFGSETGTNDVCSFYLWGAQLELGSTATNYQRTTTAYDVTESGVASCHYVQYDGSDDSMSTSAIDFTATDKMSVFAGVRKLGDASAGIIVESSATVEANTGCIILYTNPGVYGAKLRGSLNPTAITTPSAYAPPVSSILTALGDIAADINTLRVDGVQKAQSTADLGTGNFGNYPLFIGRRNNATLPFNGRDYGLVIVGKAASAGEITDTETWLAAKTSGVTI